MYKHTFYTRQFICYVKRSLLFNSSLSLRSPLQHNYTYHLIFNFTSPLPPLTDTHNCVHTVYILPQQIVSLIFESSSIPFVGRVLTTFKLKRQQDECLCLRRYVCVCIQGSRSIDKLQVFIYVKYREILINFHENAVSPANSLKAAIKAHLIYRHCTPFVVAVLILFPSLSASSLTSSHNRSHLIPNVYDHIKSYIDN